MTDSDGTQNRVLGVAVDGGSVRERVIDVDPADLSDDDPGWLLAPGESEFRFGTSGGLPRWPGPARALEEHMRAWRSVTVDAQAGEGQSAYWWRKFVRTWGRLAHAEEDVQEFAAATFLQREADMLDRADTFYVSAGMTEMITEITRHVGRDEIKLTDLPAMSGLMLFEYPIEIEEVQRSGRRAYVPTRGLGWRPAQIGAPDTRVVLGQAPDSGEDYGAGIELIAYSDRASLEKLGWKDVDRLPRLTPLDLIPWRFDYGWTDNIHGPAEVHRKWFLAACRLMWQELILPEAQLIHRNQRRQLQRLHFRLPEDGAIKVLKLRRVHHHTSPTSMEDDPDRGWKLTYRTITRGHWRRQWYPKLHDHRLIWIAPYIRGPDGAPLVLKHNVSAVVR